MAQQFLEITTGARLPTQSIKKLRNCVLMRKFASDGSETTAELLLKMLQRDPDITYMCYTGSYDDAKQLVTVRKQRKSKNEGLKSKIEQHASSDVKDYIKSVIMGLCIGSNEFLIAVMWIHKDAVHFHRLYSKMQGGDMKHRTNAEKRQLHCLIFVNSQKKNIPGIHGFVPSEAE